MVKEEHCDRNSLLSVDTDDVAAHGAQSAQDGPQRLNNQQKQKVVGKNLNLVLLTTLVCVDSLTSRERGRKVGTGTIPSSPRSENVFMHKKKQELKDTKMYISHRNKK